MPTGRNYHLFIQNTQGKFELVAQVGQYAESKEIMCSPIPGRDGIEYVPDWFGLTHFG